MRCANSRGSFDFDPSQFDVSNYVAGEEFRANKLKKASKIRILMEIVVD